MYLAPLNYDRFFKRVFSHTHIAKAFLEDFLDVKIEEIELLPVTHFLTDDAAKVEFDFRCRIEGMDIIVDMQQWYKPDVIKRFYLYFSTATTLQLEHLPEKKLPIVNNDKRAKSKDYRMVSPVLTLVWMVNDNLSFSENYVAYTIAPETALSFLQNEVLWQNKEIQELIAGRNEVLKHLNKKEKELDFLAKNRLIFMFQSNIVKDEKLTKYFKWFDFAEKTLKKENEEGDFKAYRNEEIFKEIMILINKTGLDKEDLDYIETEDEHIALVNRALEGEFIKGKDVGFVEGKEIGISEGEDKKEEAHIILLYKKSKQIAEISDLLDIPLDKVIAIIEKAKIQRLL